MANPTKQFRTVLAAVVCLTLTAGTAAGQTQEEPEPDIDERDPHYLPSEQVCPWEQATANPDLAAECLRLAEVNEGLAEYAFTRPPPAGTDVPESESGEAAAGEVPRWAMTEALTRVLTAAGVTLPATDREGRIVEPIARRVDYPDIGWLTPERQAPIYQLRNTRPVKIAEGFRDGGFGAHLPVDRWQMALFFVRTLRVIDAADPENIPALDVEAIWQNLLETPIDRVSMPFTDREVADWKTFGYSHERYRAVSLLYELGITFGDERGDYRPYDRVTGPQMGLFLVRLLAHTNVRAGEGTATPSEEDVRPPPPVKIDGTSVYDDAVSIPQETPMPADPQSRPPREIDYYELYGQTRSEFRERHGEIGLVDGGILLRASEVFGMQPGDYYWAQPTEGRGLRVFVEFTAGSGHTEPYWPVLRAWFCSVPNERTQPGDWLTHQVMRVGNGLFRLITNNRWMPDDRLNGCVIPDNIPAPAEGYTR